MKYIKKFKDSNIGNLITFIKFARVDKIKELIDSGIDLNEQNIVGNTPLIIAQLYKNYEAIKLLIESGADWSIKNIDGEDFFDHLEGNQKLTIIKSYPEKYKEYLIKKDAEKYNL